MVPVTQAHSIIQNRRFCYIVNQHLKWLLAIMWIIALTNGKFYVTHVIILPVAHAIIQFPAGSQVQIQLDPGFLWTCFFSIAFITCHNCGSLLLPLPHWRVHWVHLHMGIAEGDRGLNSCWETKFCSNLFLFLKIYSCIYISVFQ